MLFLIQTLSFPHIQSRLRCSRAPLGWRGCFPHSPADLAPCSGKGELGQTNGITPGMDHRGNSSWVWGGKEFLKDNLQPHTIGLCLSSLHPRLMNFICLSLLLLFQEKCAGYSGLIPQIIYPHCTTPPIFCFVKQKTLSAASELSGAVI